MSQIPPKDSIGTYLKEIGKYPLLSKAQEIELAKQIYAMLHPPAGLSEVEYSQLLERGRTAKKQIICANLRLVVNIAKKYPNRGLELLDLIQEGTLGLERAIQKFDPSKGYKFSTYAYWWIRQRITSAIVGKSRMIRLPTAIYHRLNKLRKIREQLNFELGRKPSKKEIAFSMELGLDELNQLLEYERLTYRASLDCSVGNQQDTLLVDLLSDNDSLSTFEEIEKSLMREAIAKQLLFLEPQQRSIINLRYGLVDGEQRSVAAIGRQMNLSWSRVRQIEAAALAKLRQRREVQELAQVNLL